MKTKHLLTISLILSAMAFTVPAKAATLPGFNISKAAMGRSDKDSSFYTQATTDGSNDSARVAVEKKAGEVLNMDLQNLPLTQAAPGNTGSMQATEPGEYKTHPYRASGIASGGILTIILYAVYAMLR